jgi:hypothetical protein
LCSYSRKYVEDFVERVTEGDKGAVLRFLHYVYDNTIGGKQDKKTFLEMVELIAEFQHMPYWEKANVLYCLVEHAAGRVSELAKDFVQKAREEDASSGTTHASTTGGGEFSHQSVYSRTAEVVPIRKDHGGQDERPGSVRQSGLPENDGERPGHPDGTRPEDN